MPWLMCRAMIPIVPSSLSKRGIPLTIKTMRNATAAAMTDTAASSKRRDRGHHDRPRLWKVREGSPLLHPMLAALRLDARYRQPSRLVPTSASLVPSTTSVPNRAQRGLDSKLKWPRSSCSRGHAFSRSCDNDPVTRSVIDGR